MREKPPPSRKCSPRVSLQYALKSIVSRARKAHLCGMCALCVPAVLEAIPTARARLHCWHTALYGQGIRATSEPHTVLLSATVLYRHMFDWPSPRGPHLPFPADALLAFVFYSSRLSTVSSEWPSRHLAARPSGALCCLLLALQPYTDQDAGPHSFFSLHSDPPPPCASQNLKQIGTVPARKHRSGLQSYQRRKQDGPSHAAAPAARWLSDCIDGAHSADDANDCFFAILRWPPLTADTASKQS